MDAYHLASKGHYESNREEWEMTRIIAYHSVLPHLKKNVSLKKFMPFDWDYDKTTTPISKKEMKQHNKNIKELFPDLG